MEYPECTKAVKRILPRLGMKMPDIRELIEGIPVLTEIQKRYYVSVMESRYGNVLLPVYKRLLKMKEGAD